MLRAKVILLSGCAVFGILLISCYFHWIFWYLYQWSAIYFHEPLIQLWKAWTLNSKRVCFIDKIVLSLAAWQCSRILCLLTLILSTGKFEKNSLLICSSDLFKTKWEKSEAIYSSIEVLSYALSYCLVREDTQKCMKSILKSRMLYYCCQDTSKIVTAAENGTVGHMGDSRYWWVGWVKFRWRSGTLFSHFFQPFPDYYIT